MSNLISTNIRVFKSLVGPFEKGKSQLFYKWLQIGTFEPKFDKRCFLYQYFQTLHFVMQKKEFDNLEFVQSVNFEFIDSLKNHR